jgi:hypothetical protein
MSKARAIHLAREGGFKGLPHRGAPPLRRRDFGESLVRGWLLANHKDIVVGVQIRATDYLLRNLPSGHPYFREVDVATTDGREAYEVKTGEGRLSGEILEDQMADYVVWKSHGTDRRVVLALVDYYQELSLTNRTLRIVLAMGVDVMRFAIRWGDGQARAKKASARAS